MPTTYRHGNILDSEARIIAHGVNAHGTPHTALARQLFHAYPEAEEDYVRTCVAQTPNVGSVILTILGDGRYLAQLVVQVDEMETTSAKGLQQAVEATYEAAEDEDAPTVAFPLIGTGVGGLGVGAALRVIEEAATGHPHIHTEVWTKETRD